MLKIAQIPAVTRFITERMRLIGQHTKKVGASHENFVPGRIGLAITDECAKKCPFCYLGREPRGQVSLTAKEARSILLKASAADIKFLVITGGEPLDKPALTLAVANEGARTSIMSAISIQTKGTLTEPELTRFINGLKALSTRISLLALNLSFSLSQGQEEANKLLAFIRKFAEADIPNGEVVLASPFEKPMEEAEEEFDRVIGNEALILRQQLEEKERELSFYMQYPLMLGSARRHRGTSFGETIRQYWSEVKFDNLAHIDMHDEDVLAVDQHRFVYPSGIFMYQGIYPIGRVALEDHNAIRDIIGTTCNDPVIKLISQRRGGEVYRLACDLRPDLKELAEVCGHPAEFYSDSLADPETALQIIERAGKLLERKS